MNYIPHAPPTAAPPLALLLCLLTLDASALAQSPAPPAQSTPAQPAALDLPVRLSVIVTDEAGRSVADVKSEEISVTEDGQPQAITRFAMEELPVSYGLVIDNSRSLTSVLDSVIRAGALIASRNHPGDETFVMRFVDSEKIELYQDFTPDFEPVRDALSRLYVEGGATAVVDALILAVRHTVKHRGTATGRRQALVLISDCEDRASFHKQSELIELLRRASVKVFVLAMPGQMQQPPARAKKLAETIAAESGGRVFFVKKKDGPELQAAVEEIARNLRSQYMLEYRPTNAALDGKFRKIEVAVAGKRKVYVQSGYFGGSIAPAPLPPRSEGIGR